MGLSPSSLLPPIATVLSEWLGSPTLLGCVVLVLAFPSAQLVPHAGLPVVTSTYCSDAFHAVLILPSRKEPTLPSKPCRHVTS